MKDEHEKVATKIDDTFANQATQSLISQSAVSVRQSGGITAQTITNSFNQPYNPYQRPPLDITPSSVTKTFPLWSLFKGGFGVLSFISIILTIIGENIFQIKDHLSESFIKSVWIWGIALLIAAALLLLFVIMLRIYGTFRLFSQVWMVFGNNIFNIQLRRTCPFSECGGVMGPRIIPSFGLRWVCARNPRLHIIEYDGLCTSDRCF